MAFIDIDTKEGLGVATFYNVNDSVGAGGRNTNEDVKVVQFFLKRAFDTQLLIETKKSEAMVWKNLVPDGKCGPITNSWIRMFQMEARSRGRINILIDGLVNKASNTEDNRIGSFSHTDYSIRVLNSFLRQEDKEVYENLTTHPLVPGDIKLIFLQIQAEGPAMKIPNG
jgi:hypothetical protein